jgi:serine/threonine protein kinase
MGSVWLADDLLLERNVALKELLQYGHGPGREELRARALREARAMARVKHPAIVHIHDVFFSDDDPWIVMEYISGRSLAGIIADHPLDEKETAAIGLPVLNGLRAAHQAKVVHRDVKPANILVADDNQIYLVDFGIAKIAGDAALTGQSKIFGTTEFIAPERLLGATVTAASDLWSLGVTFFYALEGYSPFMRHGAHSPEATIAAILRDDPPPLKRQGKLASMVPRLLRKEPAERPSAEELADVLTEALGGSASVAAPTKIVSAGHEPATQYQAQRRARRQQSAGQENKRPRPRRAPDDETSVGAADSEMLRTLPEELAAQLLAGHTPRAAAELIRAMAVTDPETAGSVVQMIPPQRAGRAFNHLSSVTAASILSIVPVGTAVRILGSADPRMAGGIIMELPGDVSAQLVREMKDAQAAAILGYVEPVMVAAVLATLGRSNRGVLTQLSPSFRALVLRHLSARA